MKQKPIDMELFFLALADRTRLRLLSLIGEDEVCVCFFVEVLKLNQPKISRHLAYLRRGGGVSARPGGEWVPYPLLLPPDFHAAHTFPEVRRVPGEDPARERDCARPRKR